MRNKWTEPYFGVTHLGELEDEFRVTIEDHKSFATLLKFRRGIASAVQKNFDSVELAKQAGEKWIKPNK